MRVENVLLVFSQMYVLGRSQSRASLRGPSSRVTETRLAKHASLLDELAEVIGVNRILQCEII